MFGFVQVTMADLREEGRLTSVARSKNHRYGDIESLLTKRGFHVVDATGMCGLRCKSETAACVAELMLHHPEDFVGLIVQSPPSHYVAIRPLHVALECSDCHLLVRGYCKVDSMCDKASGAAFRLCTKDGLVSTLLGAFECGSGKSVGPVVDGGAISDDDGDLPPPVDAEATGERGVLIVMRSRLGLTSLRRLLFSHQVSDRRKMGRFRRVFGVPVISIFCGVGGATLGVDGCRQKTAVVLGVDYNGDVVEAHRTMTGVPTCQMECGGDAHAFVAKLQRILDSYYPGMSLRDCDFHFSPPCQSVSCANNSRTTAGVVSGMMLLAWCFYMAAVATALSVTLEFVAAASCYLDVSGLARLGIHHSVLNCRDVCSVNQNWRRLILSDRAIIPATCASVDVKFGCPTPTVTSKASAVVDAGKLRVASPLEQAVMNGLPEGRFKLVAGLSSNKTFLRGLVGDVVPPAFMASIVDGLTGFGFVSKSQLLFRHLPVVARLKVDGIVDVGAIRKTGFRKDRLTRELGVCNAGGPGVVTQILRQPGSKLLSSLRVLVTLDDPCDAGHTAVDYVFGLCGIENFKFESAVIGTPDVGLFPAVHRYYMAKDAYHLVIQAGFFKDPMVAGLYLACGVPLAMLKLQCGWQDAKLAKKAVRLVCILLKEIGEWRAAAWDIVASKFLLHGPGARFGVGLQRYLKEDRKWHSDPAQWAALVEWGRNTAAAFSNFESSSCVVSLREALSREQKHRLVSGFRLAELADAEEEAQYVFWNLNRRLFVSFALRSGLSADCISVLTTPGEHAFPVGLGPGSSEGAGLSGHSDSPRVFVEFARSVLKTKYSEGESALHSTSPLPASRSTLTWPCCFVWRTVYGDGGYKTATATSADSRLLL